MSITLEEYERGLVGLDADIAASPLRHVLEPVKTMKPLPFKPNGVVLTCGTDLTPEPICWLWPNWLALGKFHLLAGAPGQGKTTIAVSMIATVTIGGRWPDGTRCEAGNVLIWSGEDDPQDTLLPRLLAAGGDRAHCFFVSGLRVAGEIQPFDPSRDMGQLLAAVEKIGGIKMLVIDPVANVVAGDSYKNTEVRRALQPLVDLASECQCVILGITHFGKSGQGSDPTQRVLGSVAFTAVARVVLVAAKVNSENGEDARILARSKSNIGPDGDGFQYYMEQVELEAYPGIEATRIAWGKFVEGSASQLLTDPNESNSAGEEEKCSALDSAKDFLKELLKDGPAPTKYLEAESKAAGIAWATVRRASIALKVKKQKSNEKYYWSLPEISNLPKQVAQVVHLSNHEQAEQPDGRPAFSAPLDAFFDASSTLKGDFDNCADEEVF